MNTYENAPATSLVATHCGICHRPLVDAVSVERGIGPVCAEKYGLDSAFDSADKTQANKIVYRLAVLISTKSAEERLTEERECMNELRAHGFDKLADKIARNTARFEAERKEVKPVVAERVPTIHVAYETVGRDAYMVLRCENLSTEIFKGYRMAITRIANSRYDAQRKCQCIKITPTVKSELIRKLEECLPYDSFVTIKSERGEMTVCGPDREELETLADRSRAM